MKKLICLTICMMFIISSFSGCNQATTPTETSTTGNSQNTKEATKETISSNEETTPPSTDYTLQTVNGEWYINIKDLEYYENYQRYEHQGISAHSTEELLKRIKNGELTESDLAGIAKYRPKDENGIKLHSLGNLYVPKIPDDVPPVFHVYYAADEITWTFTKNGINDPVYEVSTMSQELYEEKYQTLIEREGPNDISKYTLQDSSKELLISYYVIDGICYLEFVGKESGQFFHVFALIPNEPTSDEWLLSFGVEKYVEPEAPDET